MVKKLMMEEDLLPYEMMEEETMFDLLPDEMMEETTVFDRLPDEMIRHVILETVSKKDDLSIVRQISTLFRRVADSIPWKWISSIDTRHLRDLTLIARPDGLGFVVRYTNDSGLYTIACVDGFNFLRPRILRERLRNGDLKGFIDNEHFTYVSYQQTFVLNIWDASKIKQIRAPSTVIRMQGVLAGVEPGNKIFEADADGTKFYYKDVPDLKEFPRFRYINVKVSPVCIFARVNDMHIIFVAINRGTGLVKHFRAKTFIPELDVQNCNFEVVLDTLYFLVPEGRIDWIRYMDDGQFEHGSMPFEPTPPNTKLYFISNTMNRLFVRSKNPEEATWLREIDVIHKRAFSRINIPFETQVNGTRIQHGMAKHIHADNEKTIYVVMTDGTMFVYQNNGVGSISTGGWSLQAWPIDSS